MPASKMYKSRASGPKSSLRLKRAIQKVVNKNLEKKFHLNQLNSTISNLYDYHFEVSSVSQGISQGQRIGNQTRLTGIYGQFTIGPNINTVHGPANVGRYCPIVRVIMYIPKDGITNLSFASNGKIEAEIDTDQITVLYDKIFQVDFYSHKPMITIKKSFLKKGSSGILQQYDGSSATDIAKNPIKMLIFGNQSATTEYPTIVGHMKCWYTDA